jgi:vacuolar-type H+-ATPase subunit E/Vma4
LTPNDIRKAASHAKVEKTEDEAAKAHDAAVQEIQRHQSQAQRRLMNRLQKRKTLTNTQVKDLADAVNPVNVEKGDTRVNVGK